MELESRATVCAVLLMLLLLSHGGGNGGGVAEARVCTGKSQHHSFPCISDRICSNQCIKQGGGWTAGYCHWRVCRCQKAC
ncbi:defensin-like protein 2 [Phragmites australis]|uniref:defensin-like protein 2 n=1 Tax=Phragmites australis TaxID=29695 RepID=UPI002D79C057|nr:defensin-like protein 2 [Phragmites australis]